MNIVEIDKDRKQLAELFDGVGVEVGVAEGRYSKTILEVPAVVKLYGIDPYVPHKGYMDYTRPETFERMYNNTMKRLQVYPNFVLIQKFSMDAVKQFKDDSLDFVYIDANHSYATVLEDVREWTKKVKRNGIVAGDDYKLSRNHAQYEVIRALDDYGATNPIRELLIYNRGTPPPSWMFIKP